VTEDLGEARLRPDKALEETYRQRLALRSARRSWRG